MNISGIRTYAGFYDTNTIKNNEAAGRQVTGEEDLETGVRKSGELSGQQEEHQPAEPRVQIKPELGTPTYASQYQPDAVFELKGIDSDLAELDIEKAMSDMKKDQVLMQYQFFIGESHAGQSPDINRQNQNFSL